MPSASAEMVITKSSLICVTSRLLATVFDCPRLSNFQ